VTDSENIKSSQTRRIRKPRVRPAGNPPEGGNSPLYGRRKGKKLRSFQAGLVETLLPKLANQNRELWLEVGFGGGEHLAARAVENPDVGLIGCEPFVNGIAKILSMIDDQGLTNIRLHHGDAGQVIDALPENVLDRVYILYPDPWPKRRQKKRRFISDEMLVRLARVMRPGSELRFATDIDDYAGWTLARILRSTDFVWAAVTSADWLQPWAGWSSTRYEEKAYREGRKPAYMTFIRQ
jgi:tRNA (guanine-N7-)-methyltransferase